MDKNKGGRPKEGDGVKLAPLNMRTDPQLRALIEESAEATGRSLTQEVERRLRTSFLMDELFGSKMVHAFVMSLGATMHQIELRRGKKWTDDLGTWQAVLYATQRLLRWDRPQTPEEEAMRQVAARLDELRSRHDAALDELDQFRGALGMVSRRGMAMDMATPKVPGGLFGSGKTVWIDPRADWTEEQRAEEQRLIEEGQRAFSEFETAWAANEAQFSQHAADAEAAKLEGLDVADEMFAVLGPTKPRAVSPEQPL